MLFCQFNFFCFFRLAFLLFYFFLIYQTYFLFNGLEPKPEEKRIMKLPLQNQNPLRGVIASNNSCSYLCRACCFLFTQNFLNASCTASCTASCVVSCMVINFQKYIFQFRIQIKKAYFYLFYFFSGIFRNIPLYTKTKIIQHNIQKNIYNSEKIIIM